MSQEQQMVAIKGTTKTGSTVWYTGRADYGWVSPDRNDAFIGYNLLGAHRKASLLNMSTGITGITFAPDVNWTRADVGQKHNEFIAALTAVVPVNLRTKVALFARDMEDADEDFSLSIEELAAKFRKMCEADVYDE